MVWKTLDSLLGLDTLLTESTSKDIVIFKHSTTCSISHMAKMRLEENWDLHDLDIYYLDLKSTEMYLMLLLKNYMSTTNHLKYCSLEIKIVFMMLRILIFL